MNILFIPIIFSLILLSGCDEPKQQPHKKVVTLLDGSYIQPKQIDTFLEKILAELKIPGASMAITYRGNVIYQADKGLANVTKNRPIFDSTLYQAASLSKPVFSYFVMLLVEQGIITLDEPIYRHYLPAEYNNDRYLDWYKLITTRMILSHTSGVSAEQLKNGSTTRNIRFKPGSEHKYEMIESYQLLAEMIAIKLGINIEDLDDLMRDTLLPLIAGGSIFYEFDDVLLAYLPLGYDDNYNPLDQSFRMNKFTAGFGLITDVTTYARLLAAMAEGKGLSAANQQQFLAIDHPLPSRYGPTRLFGWDQVGLSFNILREGKNTLHMGIGQFTGQANFYLFDAKKAWTLVIFSNSESDLKPQRLALAMRKFLKTDTFAINLD